MASRDENQPSTSAGRYEPRPANYDKGPIFEWLQFAGTRLATTLLIRKQQVEAILKEALETRLEPILEEDFNSCRVTQGVIEELTFAIDNTIKVLETRKRELFFELGVQYPGLGEPLAYVNAKKSVEASTQTLLISDPNGSFVEDTDGHISTQRGPFLNKWVTSSVQTDLVSSISRTEDRDAETSKDGGFLKRTDSHIEQSCQTDVPKITETLGAEPSGSGVQIFHRTHDGSKIELCSCCGGAKISLREPAFHSNSHDTNATLTNMEKQEQQKSQDTTEPPLEMLQLPLVHDINADDIAVDSTETSYTSAGGTSGEPQSIRVAAASSSSQIMNSKQESISTIIENLVVSNPEIPSFEVREELPTSSNSNVASELVSLEEDYSEHANEFCGVPKDCSVVMEVMAPAILETLRAQKYISLCFSDDDEEDNSLDFPVNRTPKDEAEILLLRAVKSLERLKVEGGEKCNDRPSAKAYQAKSLPPRCDLEEVNARTSEEEDDEGEGIYGEHASHSVIQPGQLLNPSDQDLASDDDYSSDEERRNMESVLRDDSPPCKRIVSRGRQTSTDSEKVRPYIPSGCRLRISSDDDEDGDEVSLSGSDSCRPKILRDLDKQIKSEQLNFSLDNPIPNGKKKRARMISSSDSDDEAQISSKRNRKNDEMISEEELVEDNRQLHDVKPDIKLIKLERGPLNLSQSFADDDEVQEVSSQEPGRRNIRAIMSRSELRKATIQAKNNEIRRRDRVAKRNVEIGELVQSGKLILDAKNGQHLVWVDESATKLLKPHQKEGVKFLWDNCFESVDNYKKNKRGGGGCILAHCMGLGKTLQAITFAKTIMLSELLDVTRVLVLCPYNTLGNWEDELNHWLKDDIQERKIKIYRIQKKFKQSILPQLTEWGGTGGIAVMSFGSFRVAVSKKNLSNREGNAMRRYLLRPGPDVVICDEGHYFKNEKTKIAEAVSQLRTKRRIILSGTPMQNNLQEYYNMVQCVKPNLLGSIAEFRNMFVNPINNGQLKDSTDFDVSVMKKRSHVLHKMVEGTVHRQDYTVLKSCLKPKLEYTILIRLTKLQEELYVKCTEFLKKTLTKGHLLTIFHELCRVLSHPLAVSMKKEVDQKGKRPSTSKDPTQEQFLLEMEAFDNMILQALTDDSLIGKLDQSIVTLSESRSNFSDADNSEIEPKWWEATFADISVDLMEHSSKMVVLMEFIRKCGEIGDKVIVFSQFKYSLNLIERFLKEIYKDTWVKNRDYFRLDGNVPAAQREKNNYKFNRSPRAKLYLISTKAGGHGINLIGANRVILYDTSFNPSTDLQCIYRIYRFGQSKSCFVYRLVARGALDQKMYWKQVVKLSMAERVVDDHGTARHVTSDNYRKGILEYTPEDMEHQPMLKETTDELLSNILKTHGQHIHDFLEHDSLLAHCVDENLTADEQLAAEQEFERDRRLHDPDLHLGDSQNWESEMDNPAETSETVTENHVDFGMSS